MAITPVDLRNATFEKKMRGYNPLDVDALINEAAGEIERLINLNSDLQRQVLSLEDKLATFQNLEKSLKEALVTAQQAAEERKRTADRAAEVQIRETEAACAELKQQAHKEVETMRFELASLKMQKVRFTAELRSLIEAHQKLLDEKTGAENLAEVATQVQQISADMSRSEQE